MKKFITTIAAAAAAVAVATTPAHAAGEDITYLFISDVSINESSNWFDADNDQQSFTSTRLHDYGRYKSHTHGDLWSGKQSVVSRSTYHLTASSIQTGGYYAECRILVNGVTKDVEVATGRYAVAVCAA